MKVLLLSIVASLLCAPCVASDSTSPQDKGIVRNQFIGHIEALRDTVLHGYPQQHRWRLTTRPDFAVATNQMFQMTAVISREMLKATGSEAQERTDTVLKLLGKNFWRLEYLSKELRKELILIGVDYDDYMTEMVQIKKTLLALGAELRDPTRERFADVPEGHWADEAIHNLRRAGILYGYPDDKFRM